LAFLPFLPLFTYAFIFIFPTTIQNIIEINRPALPVYQSVIEKTRGLAIRTQALGAAISRSGQQPAQQKVSAN